MEKNCKQCNKLFKKSATTSRKIWNTEKKFCSRLCDSFYRKEHFTPWNKGMKGIVVSKRKDTGKIFVGTLGYVILNRSGQSSLIHRAIAEKILGRKLLSRENIHHIDEDKTNNNPSNLYLFRHNAAHTKWHQYLKRIESKGILVSNLHYYSLIPTQ